MRLERLPRLLNRRASGRHWLTAALRAEELFQAGRAPTGPADSAAPGSGSSGAARGERIVGRSQ